MPHGLKPATVTYVVRCSIQVGTTASGRPDFPHICAAYTHASSWAAVFTVRGDHQGAPLAVTVDPDPERHDPSGSGTPRVGRTT
ncbi:hypothetical protein ACWC2T_44620 [Streptomyces sp. NPDC001393]